MAAQENFVATPEPTPGRKVSRLVISALVVMIAAVSILADVTKVITISTGHSLLTFGGADGRLPLSYLPQLLQADLRQGSTGTLADADLSLRLLCATPFLVEAITIALAAALLLRVMKGIAAAEPFSPRVISGWRFLTLTLLAGGILQGLTATIAFVYLGSRIGLLFGAGRVTPEQANAFLGGEYQSIGTNLPQWPVALIVAGLVALSLAAAFRAGARLEQDVEGVV